MQDKRFYPYLFLHAGIVTLWVILDRIHKGIANDGVINLLSPTKKSVTSNTTALLSGV